MAADATFFISAVASPTDGTPRAPPGTDAEAPSPWAGHRHGHRIPWRHYCCLGLWTLLLTAGYAFTRWVCLAFQSPPDYHEHTTWLQTLYDLQQLWTFGFILAVCTGVHMPGRFGYLFCFKWREPRGLLFVAAFVLACGGWGLLDFTPLQSLTIADDSMTSFNLMILLLLGLGLFALVAWHLLYAWRHNSKAGFLVYTMSRAAVWGFYVLYFAAVSEVPGLHFHIHHYLIGFCVALLAEFNHPASLLLLAIAGGIMVQGFAAYDADPLVLRHCRPHTPPMRGSDAA